MDVKKVAMILGIFGIGLLIFANFFFFSKDVDKTENNIPTKKVVIKSISSNESSQKLAGKMQADKLEKDKVLEKNIEKSDDEEIEITNFLTTFYTYTNEDTVDKRLSLIKEQVTNELYKKVQKDFEGNVEKDQAVFSKGGYFYSYIKHVKIYKGNGQFLVSFEHYLKMNDIEPTKNEMFALIIFNPEKKISTFQPSVVIE